MEKEIIEMVKDAFVPFYAFINKRRGTQVVKEVFDIWAATEDGKRILSYLVNFVTEQVQPQPNAK